MMGALKSRVFLSNSLQVSLSVRSLRGDKKIKKYKKIFELEIAK